MKVNAENFERQVTIIEGQEISAAPKRAAAGVIGNCDHIPSLDNGASCCCCCSRTQAIHAGCTFFMSLVRERTRTSEKHTTSVHAVLCCLPCGSR